MLSKKYGNRNWKSKMRPNKNYGHKKRLNGGNESKQQERFSITTFHHAIHQTLSSRFSLALTASRKSSVYRYVPSLAPFSPWMQMAKSFNGEKIDAIQTIHSLTLVILPSSMVATHACSSVCANLTNGSLPSSLPRCSNPRVHAKMEATGFVEVGLP